MGKVNFGRKKMLPGSDLGCSERCIPGAFQGNSQVHFKGIRNSPWLGQMSRGEQEDEPWAQKDAAKE